MSEADDAWGFAPPPYKVDEALVQLRRALRELGLQERGAGFELGGRRVLELEAGDARVEARLARRLQLHTPDWDRQTLKSAADQRKLLDELKRRLARWREED